jgi:hypothetical protein
LPVWLNMAGVRVAVHPDGIPWSSARRPLAGKYQPLAEEVAMDLRRAYELNV